MYKPSNFFDKINLHFKIYIPRLGNKSILAVSQNRGGFFEMAPEVMVLPRAKTKADSSFTPLCTAPDHSGQQDHLLPAHQASLSLALLPLIPGPSPPYLDTRSVYPLSCCGATHSSPFVSPSLPLPLLPLCPPSVLFSETCNEFIFYSFPPF